MHRDAVLGPAAALGAGEETRAGRGTCGLVSKLRIEVFVHRLRRGCAFQQGEHSHEVLEEAVCQVAIPRQAGNHLCRAGACERRGQA